MKRLLFLFAGLLIACSVRPTPQPVPASTPQPAPPREVVSTSARVVPVWVSELSFPLSGVLQQVAVRPGDRVEAGQTLAVLNLPDLDFAVRQAEAALLAAQTDWEYYRVLRENKPPERRQQAQARLEAAQAALETAHLTQAQATLTAPRAGVVIAVNLKPGELAVAGQAVIVLAGLEQLQVETTDLSERYVAAIRPGQPAEIYVDALGQEFNGRVLRIAPRAGKKDGDVIFTVTLLFDEQPPSLRWGMSAEVRIRTGK